MQGHLAANVRRNNPPHENGLIVRECAIVATDIRLLAQGDMRYWIQAAKETDDADWALFEAVKTEPGFAPPLRVRLVSNSNISQRGCWPS